MIRKVMGPTPQLSRIETFADYRKDLKKCFGTSNASFRTIVRDGIRIHQKRACSATFLPELDTKAIPLECVEFELIVFLLNSSLYPLVYLCYILS